MLEEETSGEIKRVERETGDKIQKVSDESERRQKRAGYFWLVMVLTAVTGPAAAIAYSTYNTRELGRQFCDLVTGSVDRADRQMEAFRASPPTTEAGMAQMQQVRIAIKDLEDLRSGLACPPD